MKLSNYGFIMIDGSYEKEEKTSLSSGKFTTTVCCVKDIDMACKSAKVLVSEGIQLIELCGAFNGDMPLRVIEAIEGKVPVGHMEYSEEEMDKLKAFFQQ